MPYTKIDAKRTLFGYMNMNPADVKFLDNTDERGFVLHHADEDCVIFVYPISHKIDDSKNFFDTRDSGAHERGVAWNYAIQNNLKYFCFAVHDQVARYNNYIFSLECNEKTIAEVAGTENGVRAGSGTQVVIPNNYAPDKPFERILTRNGFFISAIHRDAIYDYIEKYDNRPYLLDKELIDFSTSSAENGENAPDETTRINDGANVLLYGVPGSGKSWTIEHEYCPSGSIVERLVFHPDYTNADFIGQILPVVDADKQVTYEFTPGPFTTIIRNAYVNPTRKYVLIIEEINRGNAPAIFGEVFQLLDRVVEPKTDDGIMYPVGTSEYGVTHKYMASYIYGDTSHKVRIPSNLSIIGTMNTSDQNVFTLDTAFQRRWRMRLIENSFNNVRQSLSNAEILDTEVTWKRFCETVNAIIIGNKSKMASAEDKRLGVYFIHEKDIEFDRRALPSEGYETLLIEYDTLMKEELSGELPEEKKLRLTDIRDAVMHNSMFPEKAIKYLWDDAFKFNPEALFDTDNMESLEQVIRTFVYSKGRERFKIFKPTVRASLYPDTAQ